MKITRELVERLIRLKEAYDARWPANTGKETFDISDVSRLKDTLEDTKLREKDPSTLEFYNIVESLSREERDELLALMWLGREDAGDFKDKLKHANLEIDRGGDAPYMFSKYPLADYLREGLRKMGNSI